MLEMDYMCAYVILIEMVFGNFEPYDEHLD